MDVGLNQNTRPNIPVSRPVKEFIDVRGGKYSFVVAREG
jgi:hypothetical protein